MAGSGSSCASGQSVKTTLIRLYSIILQTALDIAKDPEYEDYIDPYYTLIGYFIIGSRPLVASSKISNFG